MRLGIDVLRDDNFRTLEGKRIGLFTNASGVDSNLHSTYDRLWQAQNVQLVALFAPEHGFVTAIADGEHIASYRDARTGLPVHSLYGETERPTQAMLHDVDVVVCDIQDVGVRYYTYLWTLTHIMEACGATDTELLVLDRPNPLGGEVVAGGGLDGHLRSLVGRYPIPIQHGMTLAELAQMINALWNPHPARLSVIRCEGWQRSMRWEDTGLIWVPPSPNMPRISTVQHYAGACLIEGTNLSEGRGTPLPFEVVGAPFLDAEALAAHLNALGLASVYFRPHHFTPSQSKFAGQICHGIQVHPIRQPFSNSLFIWLTIIDTIVRQYPGEFAWLLPAEGAALVHFDRLIGSAAIRDQLATHTPITAMIDTWQDFLNDFMCLRTEHVLY